MQAQQEMMKQSRDTEFVVIFTANRDIVKAESTAITGFSLWMPKNPDSEGR